MRRARAKTTALLVCMLLACSAFVRAEEQKLSVTVVDGDSSSDKDDDKKDDDKKDDDKNDKSSSSSSSSSDGKLKDGSYDYKEVLEKSFLFYEAQRSGKLPDDNRIEWRGDAHLEDEYRGKDLTGGYYDAGDHLKITYPLAFAVTQLAWGMLEFRDGYEKSEQLKYAERTLQWGLDWLLKAHSSNDDKLIVLVGSVKTEHKNWERPEDADDERPAYAVSAKEPGADVWAAVAAAFAAGAVVYREEEKYSEELLDHAKTLYRYASDDEFSDSLYSDTLSGDEAKLYKSTRSADDLVWAAMWLYEATGDKDYKRDAEKGFAKAQENNWVTVEVDSKGGCKSKLACYWSSVRTWNWDNAYPGAMVMLAAVSTNNATVWSSTFDWLDAWVQGDAIIDKTDKGLHCIPCTECGWGADRDVMNAALLAMIASKYIDNAATRNRYRCWAQRQVDYMLGDSGRSRVVGFGEDFPDRPHHRSSSCPEKPQTCSWSTFNADKPNAHVLYGALVSGLCDDDFEDDRKDYKSNEVALDKNSGFTGVLAALMETKYQCRTSAGR